MPKTENQPGQLAAICEGTDTGANARKVEPAAAEGVQAEVAAAGDAVGVVCTAPAAAAAGAAGEGASTGGPLPAHVGA